MYNCVSFTYDTKVTGYNNYYTCIHYILVLHTLIYIVEYCALLVILFPCDLLTLDLYLKKYNII